MSASMGQYGSEMEVSYAVDFGRDREPVQKRSRHPDYRRKGSAPARVNGMHCRRNKRWTWGSGRGARMTNLRAFAGCLALAVAGLATTALGVTIDFKTIGNPGNLGNTTSGTSGPSNPSGLGAVSGVFKLATNETTNAQYVAFLNAVDPNGTNPRGIYSASMASGVNGGILKSASAAPGAFYSVKAGGPSGRPSSTYSDMPVNFVSWFSAARFVNWLENGAQSGTSAAVSMDSGVYTLGSATSGNVVARNAGTQYWLPSANEWYKAAFYNGSSSLYTLYQTGTNATPTATVSNFALANAGNFASATTGPVNAGSYTATTSSYQLFDMLGNVAEITDNNGTAGGGTYRAMGGNYGSALAALDAKSIPALNSTTLLSPGIGFRVAAVPEPGTIVLAGVGIAGLAGLDWMKRRKKRAAA